MYALTKVAARAPMLITRALAGDPVAITILAGAGIAAVVALVKDN